MVISRRVGVVLYIGASAWKMVIFSPRNVGLFAIAHEIPGTEIHDLGKASTPTFTYFLAHIARPRDLDVRFPCRSPKGAMVQRWRRPRRKCSAHSESYDPDVRALQILSSTSRSHHPCPFLTYLVPPSL